MLDAHEVLGPRLGEAQLGLVLGSGLGDFANRLQGATSVSFGDVPGMAPSSVAGHAGRFVAGKLGGRSLVVMQGRMHLYEGHSAQAVVLGVRLMIGLGAKTIVVTNAAGGIREDLTPGTIMAIEDHLNMTGHNCLLGPNDQALGPRFPDMSQAYDRSLRDLASQLAEQQGMTLPSGVYAGLLGPTYETPAEVRMLRTLGADAVGMSTVLEVIAARHMGARCLGLSCITNRAAGLSSQPLSHAEVQATAAEAQDGFNGLVEAIATQVPL